MNEKTRFNNINKLSKVTNIYQALPIWLFTISNLVKSLDYTTNLTEILFILQGVRHYLVQF